MALNNIAEQVVEYVAKRERARRFHGSTNLDETFSLDFDEAREIIDDLSNMELLELIAQAMD